MTKREGRSQKEERWGKIMDLLYVSEIRSMDTENVRKERDEL